MNRVKPSSALAYQACQQAQAAIKAEATPEIALARADLGEFGYQLTGYRPAHHHQEWISEIVTGQDSAALHKVAGEYTRIAAPRGSAKTTWLMIALAWIIGHNPGIRIIIVSYAEDIAAAISLGIKQYLESETYKEIFPWIIPSSRWSDSRWVINRPYAGFHLMLKDPTVLAVGMGGAIASRRADLIVVEDPIKSSKDIASPIIRADMVKWFGEVLEPCAAPVPGSRIFCTCTHYRVDDIHGTTFTTEKGWRVIVQKALLTDEAGNECSYWEAGISLEKLREIRERSPDVFASQYQNEPLNEAIAVIKPEWIRRGSVPLTFDAIAIGVDLAASQKETADYTALVVCGKREKFYTLEAVRARWTQYETIREIFRLWLSWNARCKGEMSVQVESVAYQAAFAPELKRQAQQEGLIIRAEAVQVKGDKKQRLTGVSGLLESDQVIFNEEMPMGLLIEELIQFGSTGRDDFVDAWVHSITKLYKTRRAMSGGGY